MLLRKIFVVLLIGIILTGCFNEYSDETEAVKSTANKINNDLLLIEETINEGGFSFELLSDTSLTRAEILKINKQYERTPYGIYYNKNALNSTGILTGYKFINYSLRKRLFKTQLLENILIEAYNTHSLIDQAYYIEGNGLLRIYPSIRVTDNFTPRTNFLEIRVFENINRKGEDVLEWFTVPFLNPSGRNWVISLFNPIYHEGVFQGVLGCDIVTSNFENQYLKKNMLIINRNGDIISIDSSLFQLFNIEERESDVYYEEVMAGKLPNKDYNLNNSRMKDIRVLYKRIINNESNFTIELDQKYFVISEKIDVIDSYLIKIIQK